MAISYRGITQAYDASFGVNSLTIAAPSGTVVGDGEELWVSIFTIAPGNPPLPQAISGWTLRSSSSIDNLAGGLLNVRSTLYTRNAGAAAKTETVATTGGTNAGIAITRKSYSGQDPAGYFGQVNWGVLSSAGTSLVVPSQTTGRANSQVSYHVTQTVAQSITPPGTLTERVDNASMGISNHDAIQASAGAVGTRTFTLPSSAQAQYGYGEFYVDSAVAATGAASGTSTAAGIGAATNAQSGAASGTSTAAGVGASTAEASGVASGAASAAGIGASTAAAAGSAAGTSTAAAVGAVAGTVASGAGSAAGSSTASGVGAALAAATGAATGTGAAAGVGASAAAAAGSAAGAAAASGVGRSTAAAVGSASGVATVQGVGTSVADGTGIGSAAGSATAAGVGASTAASVGSASGTSSATAVGQGGDLPPAETPATWEHGSGTTGGTVDWGPLRRRWELSLKRRKVEVDLDDAQSIEAAIEVIREAPQRAKVVIEPLPDYTGAIAELRAAGDRIAREYTAQMMLAALLRELAERDDEIAILLLS